MARTEVTIKLDPQEYRLLRRELENHAQVTLATLRKETTGAAAVSYRQREAALSNLLEKI